MVTECFLTCSWRFLISNRLEQLEFKLERLLGFRNLQEILENKNTPLEKMLIHCEGEAVSEYPIFHGAKKNIEEDRDFKLQSRFLK